MACAALFISPFVLVLILGLGLGLGLYAGNVRCPKCLDRPLGHRPHMFYRAFKPVVPPFCPYCGYDCHLAAPAAQQGAAADGQQRASIEV